LLERLVGSADFFTAVHPQTHCWGRTFVFEQFAIVLLGCGLDLSDSYLPYDQRLFLPRGELDGFLVVTVDTAEQLAISVRDPS
jgi:hypothetical protein